MKAYLSPENEDSGTIPVDSWAGVYRDPDHDQKIAVETESGVSHLGIADATVSRKKGSDPPIALRSQSDFIEVRNQGNTNGVLVRTKGEDYEIEEGFSVQVSRDAVIEIGYQTALRLTVDRDARVEIQGGDYVAGDKTEVQDSVVNRSDIGTGESSESQMPTGKGGSVEDSVVNRSQIEGGGSVDESVVNRSTIGGSPPADKDEKEMERLSQPGTGESADESDTQNACEIHDILYTGEVCPLCAEESDSNEETKFCLYCGEAIPVNAQVCPNCGSELPENIGD